MNHKVVKERINRYIENAEMSGILDYELLCEKFSKDVVNSLIEYNIIHLRPTSHMSFDVLMHWSQLFQQNHLLLLCLKLIVGFQSSQVGLLRGEPLFLESLSAPCCSGQGVRDVW